MNKSKIEWCDYTWNPVTGCLHNCPYCYAKRIVTRFSAHAETNCEVIWNEQGQEGPNRTIDEPWTWDEKIQPYPFGFEPTFHRYRLDEPQKIKKPSKVFVCSMADLFGDFIPDEWIEEIFNACEAAPQHTYLFLTKNPKRYLILPTKWMLLKGGWFGTTATQQSDIDKLSEYRFGDSHTNRFLSIEPILGPINIKKALGCQICEINSPSWYGRGQNRHLGHRSQGPNHYGCNRNLKWVIIGAQTGSGAVPPKREWVQSIMDQCKAAGVPVFLKNSLKALMGDNFIQEWPAGISERLAEKL